MKGLQYDSDHIEIKLPFVEEPLDLSGKKKQKAEYPVSSIMEECIAEMIPQASGGAVLKFLY